MSIAYSQISRSFSDVFCFLFYISTYSNYQFIKKRSAVSNQQSAKRARWRSIPEWKGDFNPELLKAVKEVPMQEVSRLLKPNS
ncbi:hypothetical protein AFK68_28570 [Hydrocoleum sp. CS-953]|nr:hypothetical protein AFK68_28570 [Hydrocoleum sp. CS-953]